MEEDRYVVCRDVLSRQSDFSVHILFNEVETMMENFLTLRLKAFEVDLSIENKAEEVLRRS